MCTCSTCTVVSQSVDRVALHSPCFMREQCVTGVVSLSYLSIHICLCLSISISNSISIAVSLSVCLSLCVLCPSLCLCVFVVCVCLCLCVCLCVLSLSLCVCVIFFLSLVLLQGGAPAIALQTVRVSQTLSVSTSGSMCGDDVLLSLRVDNEVRSAVGSGGSGSSWQQR
jgi:hypothetical protein